MIKISNDTIVAIFEEFNDFLFKNTKKFTNSIYLLVIYFTFVKYTFIIVYKWS